MEGRGKMLVNRLGGWRMNGWGLKILGEGMVFLCINLNE